MCYGQAHTHLCLIPRHSHCSAHTLTHLRPHRLPPLLGTRRRPEVNRALGSRRGWAGIWGPSVGRGSTQSPRPLLLVALHPPFDHILPLSSFLQPPLPPQMTQTGHHPLPPACFLNTESWAERNCRLAGCSPVLVHTYPSPRQPPASLTCSSWNSRSTRTRWQSRVTRSRALAAASWAGSLSGGPTRARRSARALWGSEEPKVKEPQYSAQLLGPLSLLRWT